MERRTFLKLASFAIVSAAGRLAFPWAAAAASRDVSYAGSLYRMGGAGKIQTSADGGATWTLHSDLGDIFSVSRLVVDRKNRLVATVAYGARSFTLSLGANKRSWLTT